MTTSTNKTTLEPCANCGTPLAADQRYCLNCGDRRAEARLDFIDILSEDAAGRAAMAAATAAGAEANDGHEGWVRHNTGLLALASVLVLALFVGGVAVGGLLNNSDSSASTAAKPPVIKVVGVGVGAGTAAASGDTSSNSSDSNAGSKSSSSSGTDKAETGGSGSTKGVQSADNKSKKDIEKSVDKGEPLSTGSGSLPKTDNKAAGGGSDFETIQ